MPGEPDRLPCAARNNHDDSMDSMDLTDSSTRRGQISSRVFVTVPGLSLVASVLNGVQVAYGIRFDAADQSCLFVASPQRPASCLRPFSFSCIHPLNSGCCADHTAIAAAVLLEISHVALSYPSRHQTRRLVSTTMGPCND
jgi:hypothetical protein